MFSSFILRGMILMSRLSKNYATYSFVRIAELTQVWVMKI